MNWSDVGVPSFQLSLDEFENYNLKKKSSICLALTLKRALKETMATISTVPTEVHSPGFSPPSLTASTKRT